MSIYLTCQRNCAHPPPHTPLHFFLLYIHTGKGGGFVGLLVADTQGETEETSTTHTTAASKKQGRRIKRIIQNIRGQHMIIKHTTNPTEHR